VTEIVAVRGYRQHQPFVAGEYSTSGGSAAGFDSMIVALDTAGGVTGWGEMAPLGSFYAPAFAAGARAGLAELAPALLGQDADQPLRLAERMDAALLGHPYVKSAVDMACWDAAGRIAGLPLCTLLGGGAGQSVELYRSIPPVSPGDAAGLARRHLAEGYRRLQVKVGGDPALDAERLAAVRDAVGPRVVLFADANAGWSTSSALQFARLAAGIDHVLEQPCATLAECRLVREHCAAPMVLDESIGSMAALLDAWRDGVAGGVTIKIARVGGVTRAAQIRDVAVELGMMVTVEDTGGASIDTAAMAHLSASTPERHRMHTVDFNAWVTVDNADGMPAPSDGRLSPPDGPGLGVRVMDGALGDPFLQVP
jgi:L-alanine-DL-glutamate epimerase-like enolase superfamily enzyme